MTSMIDCVVLMAKYVEVKNNNGFDFDRLEIRIVMCTLSFVF